MVLVLAQWSLILHFPMWPLRPVAFPMWPSLTALERAIDGLLNSVATVGTIVLLGWCVPSTFVLKSQYLRFMSKSRFVARVERTVPIVFVLLLVVLYVERKRQGRLKSSLRRLLFRAVPAPPPPLPPPASSPVVIEAQTPVDPVTASRRAEAMSTQVLALLCLLLLLLLLLLSVCCLCVCCDVVML